MNRDAGDLAHGIGATLHVLDVQRGEYVDAGVQQFDDILVALGMTAPRRVGVSQLIDQHEPGLAREHGFQIELVERDAAVLDRLARNDGKAGQESLGFAATMGLDDSDDDICAIDQLLLRGTQHGEGLADPRHMPKNIFSRPRLARASSRLSEARMASGSGRRSAITTEECDNRFDRTSNVTLRAAPVAIENPSYVMAAAWQAAVYSRARIAHHSQINTRP